MEQVLLGNLRLFAIQAYDYSGVHLPRFIYAPNEAAVPRVIADNINRYRPELIRAATRNQGSPIYRELQEAAQRQGVNRGGVRELLEKNPGWFDSYIIPKLNAMSINDLHNFLSWYVKDIEGDGMSLYEIPRHAI